MNYDRLRQSYIFNLLCLYGLVLLGIFLSICLYLLYEFNGLLIFVGIIIASYIGAINILVFLSSLVLGGIEAGFKIKIKNEKYLKNKKVILLQNIGILAFFLSFLFARMYLAQNFKWYYY